ncbi:type 2 periplasmic-binding domain-containing protein [Micrococcus luteus]|uniref:hypothetical protein n=1 Tax=Micrococcus luteus TaxID=1270 RepID=UPI0011DDF419|nr:hypothetical protein [Micrococcus luteus]
MTHDTSTLNREWPVNIHSSSLHEVQNHLAVTGHKYELNPFVISTQTWATLAEEDQQLLTDIALEARDYQRELMQEQTDNIYAEFDEELEVTHPDRDAFRNATNDVYGPFAVERGGVVSQGARALVG